ncbi:MAG: ABC transporter permease [Candidatus Carbobacillus altaicus]|nr:ABC transporter permease [Candidatus Carbobacillus altaicus]
MSKRRGQTIQTDASQTVRSDPPQPGQTAPTLIEGMDREQWIKAFFYARIKRVRKTRLSLIRRWLNGFGAIPVLLLLLLLAFYPQAIETLPADFPLALVISVVFAFLLAVRRVRPWFLEEDLYYLVPLGKALAPFWQEVERYTTRLTHIGLSLVWLLLLPLFLARIGSLGIFLLMGFVILALNRLSVYVFFRGIVFPPLHNFFLRVFYGLIIALMLYGLFTHRLLLYVFTLVLILFFFLGVHVQTRHAPLPYERLVMLERKLARREARLWGTFFEQPTTVRAPYVLVPSTYTGRERRRKSVMWPYTRKHVLFYLYVRLWLRNGDVRQWLLNVLVVYVLMRTFPYTFLQLAMVVLFSWLMLQQMLTAEDRYTEGLWLKLFPLKPGEVRASYRRFARRIVALYAFFAALGWGFLNGWFLHVLS